jgi:hypothetical protein
MTRKACGRLSTAGARRWTASISTLESAVEAPTTCHDICICLSTALPYPTSSTAWTELIWNPICRVALRCPLPGEPIPPSRCPTLANVIAYPQPPPPTLREILSAYALQGREDREMLIALLNAKAAEDQRVTSVATLQQQVVQMQMTVLSAQIHQTLLQPTAPAAIQDGDVQDMKQEDGRVARSDREERRSPVSPSPPKRHRSRTPARMRTHPYSHARSLSREADQPLSMSRGTWELSLSDERSTSEEGGSGAD